MIVNVYFVVIGVPQIHIAVIDILQFNDGLKNIKIGFYLQTMESQ